MNAVAVPHIADVVGDTIAIVDCVLAKLRSGIFALCRALGDSKPLRIAGPRRPTT
jgi:hypothetical protein